MDKVTEGYHELPWINVQRPTTRNQIHAEAEKQSARCQQVAYLLHQPQALQKGGRSGKHEYDKRMITTLRMLPHNCDLSAKILLTANLTRTKFVLALASLPNYACPLSEKLANMRRNPQRLLS